MLKKSGHWRILLPLDLKFLTFCKLAILILYFEKKGSESISELADPSRKGCILHDHVFSSAAVPHKLASGGSEPVIDSSCFAADSEIAVVCDPGSLNQIAKKIATLVN